MQKSRILLGAAALAAALLTAGTTSAADCLQLDLSASTPLCIGQIGSVSATMSNSCSTQERGTIQLAVDGQPLEASRKFRIAGDSTLTRAVSFPVPNSVSAGSHTLTVTLTDTDGTTTTATVDLSVTACSTGQPGLIPVAPRFTR